MNLSFLSLLAWWLAILLEAAVLCLAWRRKLAEQLPFFVGYLFLLLASEFVLYGTYRLAGFNSKASFYTYWILQALLVSLRAIVVYEICRRILSPLIGLWRILKPAMFAVAVILVAAAAISAYGKPYYVTIAILAGERGIELVVAGLLIAGLAFCRYYRVTIERHLLWIALGLGFYSVFQIADNTYLQHWLGGFTMWEALQHASFKVALLAWGVALWKPLPAEHGEVIFLSRSEYDNLRPVVTTRLRELNTRLLELWK